MPLVNSSVRRTSARLLALVVALAACSDSVMAPRQPAPLPPAVAAASYTCDVRVQERSISCGPTSNTAPATSAVRRPNLDVIYGGQGLYTQLASANTSYDVAEEIFQSDVTVKNLLRDPIGTKDLATVTPQGVRVFFTQEPIVTGGTGTVTIANADGVGTFTAGAQPYFQYNQVLIQNQTSNAKTWQWDVPNTVTSFSFKVAVSAAVGPRLVITEILADPTTTGDAGEWFEVTNNGVEAVDMTGWKFVSRSGSAVPFVMETPRIVPAGIVIPVGGCKIFGNSSNTATNGGMVFDFAYSSLAMANNTNDNIMLKTPADVTMDSVQFTSAPPNGSSRILRNPNSVNSSMGDTAWFTATTDVSPTNPDNGRPCGMPTADSYPGIGGLSNATGSGGSLPLGPVTSVIVSPSPATVATGATRQFSAVARDANSNPVSTTFTWASSNTSVATIDPATGLATGVAVGTTTITATSANSVVNNPGTTLTVNAPGVVASLSINPNDSPADVPPGYTRPFFYTARDGSGAVINPAPSVTWSSSNTSVATIDQLGYATGVSAGTTTIRAETSNGTSATYTLTIIGTETTTAVYREHLEFGTPEDATPADDYLLEHPQFALSYNDARGGPNWVSWNLNASHRGSQSRCNCFSNDQSLPASFYKVTDFDYRNGGYDRGHMVMSNQRSTTLTENAATFLLSNILPQSGTATGNNQGPWLNFENYLNTQSDAGKEIYNIAGGIYGATPPTLKGEGHVAIPEYTWKIVVIMDAGETLANVSSASDIRVIAVKMPNFTGAHASPGDPRYGLGLNTNWTLYKTTVDALEAATGYNFLDLLADSIENAVESTPDP